MIHQGQCLGCLACLGGSWELECILNRGAAKSGFCRRCSESGRSASWRRCHDESWESRISSWKSQRTFAFPDRSSFVGYLSSDSISIWMALRNHFQLRHPYSDWIPCSWVDKHWRLRGYFGVDLSQWVFMLILNTMLFVVDDWLLPSHQSLHCFGYWCSPRTGRISIWCSKSSAGKLSWRRYFMVLRLEFWSNPLHQGLKDHLDDTCCIIGISSASCFPLIVDPRPSSPVLHCWDTAWSPPRQSGYNMKALKLVYVWCLRCIK